MPVDELCKIRSAHEPRRFLATQPEGSARKQLSGSASARLLVAESKVFRSNFIERDVRFPELGKQTEECVHVSALRIGRIRADRETTMRAALLPDNGVLLAGLFNFSAARTVRFLRLAIQGGLN